VLEEPANSVFYTEQGAKEAPQHCWHLSTWLWGVLISEDTFNGLC